MRYERAKKLVFALVGGLMVALLAFQLFLRGHRSVQHVPRASAASLLSQGSSEAKSATPTEGQAALSMQLPAALLTSIADELPGYSLPDASTGDHPFRYLCETREASPFYSVGDFTGAGRQEFALILTGPEKLRFAIFGADTTGKFSLVYVARPKTVEEWGAPSGEPSIERAEQIDVCKIPKGKPWAPEAGDTFEDVRSATDAVAIHTHPNPNDDLQSLIVYEDGAFQQIFSEPLVRLR